MSRTELARHTRRVLSDVQRGRTILIDAHGEREAALLGIVDYRILRAVMRYYAKPPGIDPATGLPEAQVQALDDAQARYGLVFAHYLAWSICLSRAAELRTRCLRLDIPMRAAPGDADAAMVVDW